jgi:N-acyl amino acid synthase FeeM
MRPLDEPQSSSPLYVGPPRSATELVEARRLHSRVYSDRGLIDSSTALFDDGYMTQRQWVIASDHPLVVGTVSFIRSHSSLPTLDAFGIDPTLTPRLSLPWSQGRVVEISTFLVDRTYAGHSTVAPLLYRAMWQQRYERNDHDIWIMSSRPQLIDRVTQVFPGPFELLGRARAYYNNEAVAYMVDLRVFRHALALRSPDMLAWLDGHTEAF